MNAVTQPTSPPSRQSPLPGLAGQLPGPPLNTLVVGGDRSFIERTVAPNLAGFQRNGRVIRYLWHWDYRKAAGTELPKNCDLVVICTDMVGHAHSDKAKTLASAANLPCLLVTRKWAESIPRLRSADFHPIQEYKGPMQTTPANTPVSTIRRPAPASTGAAQGAPAVEAPPFPLPERPTSNEDRARLLRYKHDFARDLLLRSPTAGNGEISGRFESHAKSLWPATRTGLDMHSKIISAARAELGIGLVNRGQGRFDVHLQASKYEVACAKAGLKPNYVGVASVLRGNEALPAVDLPEPVTLSVKAADLLPPTHVTGTPVKAADLLFDLSPPAHEPPVVETPVVETPVSAPVPPTPTTPATAEAVKTAVQLLVEALKAEGYHGQVLVDLDSRKLLGKRRKVVIVDEDVEVEA